MTHQADVNALSLSGIAHRCAQETDRFFQRKRHDPRYCFELFRRAIVDHCERAWELVYVQYAPLVSAWVKRHPAFLESGEEAQYFVNRAFQRMWGAISSDRLSRFPDLKFLLRYLQMCVHSVILDKVRAAEHAVVARQVEDIAAERVAADPGAENPALARVYRQEFWTQINARLRTDQERCVMYGSFLLALKPRDIVDQFPGTFGDVREVYRVKENVLARLSRDAELRRILSPDA